MSGFTSADVPDQSGRRFLVTGANTGIGFEAAKVFAARGATVVLGCRDADKALAAMDAIRGETPETDLHFLPLDLADLDSIRAAAGALEDDPVDVLVNNAGVMIPPLMRTRQGFELQFGVNHLGTFALTSLLLPQLAQRERPRVVITGSIAHRRGQIDFADPQAQLGYKRAGRYAMSKLANLLFLFELNRRLRAANSPIAAIGCHPGVSLTELMRHIPAPLRAISGVAGPLLNPVGHAAWPTLQAATDPAAQGGDYFGPRGFREMKGASGKAFRKPQALDAQAAVRLWDISIEATGIDPGLPAAGPSK